MDNDSIPPEAAKPTADELRAQLKAAMNDVLASNKTMTKAARASAQAATVVSQAKLAAQTVQQKSQGGAANAAKAQELFEQLLAAGLQTWKSVYAQYPADVAAFKATEQNNADRIQLKMSMTTFELDVLDPTDYVLQAASFMLSKEPSRIDEAPEQSDEAKFVPPPTVPIASDEVHHRYKETAVSSFLALHKAYALQQHLDELAMTLYRTSRNRLTQPVRPTEEEVARYLRQAEDQMLEKQAAQEQSMEAWQNAAKLVDNLTEYKDTLYELNEAADLQIASEEEEPSLALTMLNRRSYAWLPRKLTDMSASTMSALASLEPDTIQNPHTTNSDRKDIDKLRRSIREVALAMGGLNESKSAGEQHIWNHAVHSLPDPPKLATQATSWEECLELRQKRREAEAENERQRISWKAKTELLKESAQKYDSLLKERRRALRRLIIDTIDKRKLPPCAELRVWLNVAAMVLTSEYQDPDKKRKLSFPIY